MTSQIITQDKDQLLFLVLSEDNKEYFRVPVYVSEETSEKMPQLGSAIKDLPKLMEMIYNSGKNNEEITFNTITDQI